jgi:TolB-like protein
VKRQAMVARSVDDDVIEPFAKRNLVVVSSSAQNVRYEIS